MSETMQIRIILAIGILFLFSMVSSCSELGYALSGKSVDAQLMGIEEVRVRNRRSSTTKLQVKYRFEDPKGSMRSETDTVSTSFEPDIKTNEEGFRTVAVEYRPGRPLKSRLKGNDEMFWVYIFLGSLAAAGGSIGWFLYTYYKK